jgi:hypothetical protein
MVLRSVYITVDFSYLNVSNNKKKLVTATGEQRHKILPPQMELLAAGSCALHNNKSDTVDFWDITSMIRKNKKTNMWQTYNEVYFIYTIFSNYNMYFYLMRNNNFYSINTDKSVRNCACIWV